MSTPEPNHNTPSDEIEQVLSRARFRPDAGFEESLHTRLRENLPEPEKRQWWQRMGEQVIGSGDQVTERGMRSSKLLPALSVGVLGLMLFLFVRLVLVKPTGFGDTPTPTVNVTEEAYVDEAHSVGMRFGGELDLTEALVERSGDAWTVSLWWQVVQQPQRNYTIAIFAGDGTQIISQIDAPLTGADLLSSNSDDWNLPTSQWLQNRFIASTFTLKIPVDGPEPTNISVEVHDPENNWILTLEKDGYSLSTVQAGVWDASQGTPVAESTHESVSYQGCSPVERCRSEDGRYWMHEVREGDTLALIAAEYGPGMDCIMQANGFPDDPVIMPGSVIKVCTSEAQPTPVSTGVTVFRALSLSGDGKWLAVESYKERDWPHVHVINLDTREATFISHGAWPSLDSDGSTVGFVIQPKGEAINPTWQRLNMIFTAATSALGYFDVSSSAGLGEQPATMPDLDGEGSAVVFLAHPGAVEGMPSLTVRFDVYVYDKRTQSVEHISMEEYGDEPYLSANPSISDDGRYVAFAARTFNADSTQPKGVFVWDRQEETLRHVGEGFFPQISGDGSTVAYLRSGGEPGQGEGWINGLATNLITGETRWLGRVLDAAPDGIWTEKVFSLSHDGSRIAFWSVLPEPRGADIPAPEPSGGLGSAYSSQAAFVYDWNTDALTSHQPPFNSIGITRNPVLSADGNILIYLWNAGTGEPTRLIWTDLAQGQFVDLSEGLVMPEP
jgi:Tol biopolymer transport system component